LGRDARSLVQIIQIEGQNLTAMPNSMAVKSARRQNFQFGDLGDEFAELRRGARLGPRQFESAQTDQSLATQSELDPVEIRPYS
jgi:hypothetical protein